MMIFLLLLVKPQQIIRNHLMRTVSLSLLTLHLTSTQVQALFSWTDQGIFGDFSFTTAPRHSLLLLYQDQDLLSPELVIHHNMAYVWGWYVEPNPIHLCSIWRRQSQLYPHYLHCLHSMSLLMVFYRVLTPWLSIVLHSFFISQAIPPSISSMISDDLNCIAPIWYSHHTAQMDLNSSHIFHASVDHSRWTREDWNYQNFWLLYVPSISIRLYLPQSHFRLHPASDASFHLTRKSASLLAPGFTQHLSFPLNPLTNLPIMIIPTTSTQVHYSSFPDTSFNLFSTCLPLQIQSCPQMFLCLCSKHQLVKSRILTHS